MPGGAALAKRGGEARTGMSKRHVSVPSEYSLPENGVGLTGPVERPAPGTLPLRGDLAHIALAGRFLAAHYVVPIDREVGDAGAAMRLAARDDAQEIVTLDAGSQIEVLDYSGPWAWVACGPEGPSGYLHISELASNDGA